MLSTQPHITDLEHCPTTLQYTLQVAGRLAREQSLMHASLLLKESLKHVHCWWQHNMLFKYEKQRSIKGSENALWERTNLRPMTSSMKWGESVLLLREVSAALAIAHRVYLQTFPSLSLGGTRFGFLPTSQATPPLSSLPWGPEVLQASISDSLLSTLSP